MSPTKPFWSVPVTLADIPEAGRHFDLAVDEATREALAKLAGLRTLPRLEAAFDVARHIGGGLHVIGRVTALVGQNCVVTLDPMENELAEDIDLVFLPQREAPAAKDEVSVSGNLDPDAVEPLSGDVVDLGKIATDFLLLGIDPYPRRPDAKFQPPAVEEDPATHPFAALAALKKGQSSDGD
jgi:hypothetical protein